jgi:hypothetical protein
MSISINLISLLKNQIDIEFINQNKTLLLKAKKIAQDTHSCKECPYCLTLKEYIEKKKLLHHYIKKTRYDENNVDLTNLISKVKEKLILIKKQKDILKNKLFF